MRFVLITFMLLGLFKIAHSQDLKLIRVGGGIGYASPSGKGGSGGLLYYIEPGYQLKDQILVGLRVERCVTTRASKENIGVSIDRAGITSASLLAQYYFGDEAFRPYAGWGVGLYFLEEVFANGELATGAESKVGFFPRVGFELVHFNFSIDYNIIPTSKFVDGSSSVFNNSYFGFRIGATFGGDTGSSQRYNPRKHKRIRSK